MEDELLARRKREAEKKSRYRAKSMQDPEKWEKEKKGSEKLPGN